MGYYMKFYHSPIDLEELPDPKNCELENEFGFLFYHYLPLKLTKRQENYVENCELEIDYSERFTKEEDSRIMENFLNFKTKHFNSTASSVAIVGFRYPWQKKKDFQHFVTRTENIWPNLCSGLQNRTAYSIQQRLSLILDDHYEPGTDEPTEEHLKVLSSYDRLPGAIESRKIWANHRIPFYFVVKHFAELRDREKRSEMESSSQRRLSLFNALLNASKVSEIEFAKTLSKLNINKIHRLFAQKHINWRKLSRVGKWKNLSKDEWIMLVEKLVQVYQENMMETEKRGEYSKETWLMCKKIVFGQAAQFCDRVCLVRCVYKCVNPKATSLTQKDAVDCAKLQKILGKLGLFGLCSSESCENWPEYSRLVQRVKQLDENVFKSLNPQPTLKEKLMIYFEALMRRNTAEDKCFRKLFEIVREVVQLYYGLKYDEQKRKLDGDQEEKVPKKIIKVAESPVLRRLRIRVLTEEEKRNVQIVRLANQSIYSSSSADESTFVDTTESTFLRPDETVIAGGGQGTTTLLGEQEENEFSSRIIDVPIREVEQKVIINPPILPKEPTDNWLDLLG